MGTPPTLSAPARLNLLLPWLNGEAFSADEVRRLVMSFVLETRRAWQARPDCPLLGASVEAVAGVPYWQASRTENLRATLAEVLDGASPATRRPATWRQLPSLRWDVIRVGSDQPPWKVSRLSRRDRRAHFAPGTYRQLLAGEPADLVVYCLVRTLTEEGAVALARCPAPAPRDWSRRCERWFCVTGGGRGRPREYCSLKCRKRRHAEIEAATTHRHGRKTRGK